jgi:hypothetical protein
LFILLWMVLWGIVVSFAAGIVMVPLFMGLAAVRVGGATGPAGAIVAGLIGIVIVVLAFAGFIAIYVRYALAIQACVVEDLGPRASLKRSILLSKGSRWRIVAIYLVFLLLSMILGFGLNGLAIGAGTLLHNKIAAAVLIYVAAFIVGSITGPLATIGLSLLYYDERVRKEAFDLQLMMSSLDVPGSTLAPPAPTPAQI